MNITKRNTIVIGASIMPRHVEMCDHILEDRGTFKSRSEVIQRALETFHDKLYPAYIFALSPAQTIKKNKIEEAQKAEADFNAMSPFDYATKVLKGYPLKDNKGRDWVIFMTIRKNLIPVLVEGIKKWAPDNAFILETHLEELKTGGVFEVLNQNVERSALFNNFGIIVPETDPTLPTPETSVV